jgi:hypothetical protein
LIVLLLDMGCSKKTSVLLGADHGTGRNHNVGRNSCPHDDRTHPHPHEILDGGTVNHGPEGHETFLSDDTRPVDDDTVGNGGLRSDSHRCSSHGMDNDTVLDVRTGLNHHGLYLAVSSGFVGPDDRKRPYKNIRIYSDVADDLGGRVNKRRRLNCRSIPGRIGANILRRECHTISPYPKWLFFQSLTKPLKFYPDSPDACLRVAGLDPCL